MSMEAEVMRARCVSLLAKTIEAAEFADQRSVRVADLKTIMLHMVRLDLPGEENRAVPRLAPPQEPAIIREANNGAG